LNTEELPREGSAHFVPRPTANPDDPPVVSVRQSVRGPQPEPYFRGLPGRGAIVEGQVFVVAFIFIAQLWLVTEALYQLLSGQRGALGWLALASFLGFIIAVVVWRWPRHHLEN
jgi:hypothetical protein